MLLLFSGLRLQSLSRTQRVCKSILGSSNAPVDEDEDGDIVADADGDDGVQTNRSENQQCDGGNESICNDDVEHNTLPCRTECQSVSDDSSTEISMEQPSLPLPETNVDSGLAELDLVFRPHPQDPDSQLGHSSVRYIKTTANATGSSFFCSITNCNIKYLVYCICSIILVYIIYSIVNMI